MIVVEGFIYVEDGTARSVEHWAHGWNIVSSIPGSSSGRFFFFRVNFLFFYSVSILPRYYISGTQKAMVILPKETVALAG